MLNKFVYSSCLILLFINVSGQEEDNYIKSVFKGTRLINGHSANLAEQGELYLQIQHRFGDVSDGLYEFFGLDQATMRLGFEYGIARNLTVGIGRSTMFKTYDASIKFKIAQQSAHFPLTISTTFEGSVPTQKHYFPETYNNFSDKFSGSAQLHFAKTIGIVGLQITPGYLHTGYLPIEVNKYEMFTLGFGGSVKVSKKVSLNMEYLHHFENNLPANKPLSLGIDLDTGGHLFQIMVTNSQAMFNQALYTNTMGDWGKGNLYFGFNLIREFKLKYNDSDFNN